MASQPTWKEVWDLLRTKLSAHLQATSRLERVASLLQKDVEDNEVLSWIDDIISDKQLSYRDGVLIQLAWCVNYPGSDAMAPQRGGRSLAQALGGYLKAAHVSAVADAFQNIGKNTRTLVRGNHKPFDSFLTWAAGEDTARSRPTRRQLFLCLEYACGQVMATARPVSPMPDLDVSRLTFGRVMGLVMSLLSIPSGGTYQQMLVAALVDAVREQAGLERYRVSTKRVNASDKSSGAAGDVEVALGNRILEALEVTDGDWRGKLPGLPEKMKEHDLTRAHVIAPVSDYGEAVKLLLGIPEDVAVVDLQGFAATLVASLTKVFRKVALVRLHELLERHEDDITKVNAFVTLLSDHGLSVGGTRQQAN